MSNTRRSAAMIDTYVQAPCHFLELPTEVRLMIYRYVLPSVIQATHNTQTSIASLLRTSRTINQEASSVLYGESQFQASGSRLTIQLQGRSWWRCRGLGSLSTKLSPSARLIRHLTVRVDIGSWSIRSLRSHERDFSGDEYELYETRNNVRKLVDFLASRDTPLKRLDIEPVVTLHYHWSAEQVIAALFMVIGPFEELANTNTLTLALPKNKERRRGNAGRAGIPLIASLHTNHLYNRLREEWLSSITGSTPTPGTTNNEQGKLAYNSIEELLQLISDEGRYGSFETRSLIYRIFEGIERLLHFTHVAYENGDLDTMIAIREAIRVQWINLQSQLSQPACTFAKDINNVFKAMDAAEPPELYPHISTSETESSHHIPTRRARKGRNWAEIQCKIPRRGEPGVTIKEDSWRIYVYKDNKMWTRLKTPQTVREANA
jgi:hypothetical protein